MAGELKHKSVGTELTQGEFEALDGHLLSSQAKGDLIAASSATQLERLSIDSDDLVLTADAAEQTGMKWAAAVSGALSFEGSQVTEATTTSTSTVALITVSSLSIGATIPIEALWNFRKTTGAVHVVRMGVRINTTTTKDPTSLTASDDSTQTGTIWLMLPSRVTNYLKIGVFVFSGTDKNNTVQLVAPQLAVPNATITDVIGMGSVGDAAITLGADEMFVYSRATS